VEVHQQRSRIVPAAADQTPADPACADRELREHATTLGVALAGWLARDAIACDPTALTARLDQLLAQAAGTRTTRLRVHPADLAHVRARCPDAAADATLDRGDLVLDHEEGAFDMRVHRQLARAAAEGLAHPPSAESVGRVTELVGLVLRARVPGVRTGELCEIDEGRLLAEVVGFREDGVVLMPLGSTTGIGPSSLVRPIGRAHTIDVGPGLLGRVLDGLGQPCDGRGPLAGPLAPWSIQRAAPDPLTRRPVIRPLALGVRALDALVTVGEGQRLGLFAGSGMGKSSLLAQIARGADTDVTVIALIGERGREVRDFLDEALDPATRDRAVIVCATADMPPLVRLRAGEVAIAVAEWFRERGERVLFLMDSLTRLLRAQRELALACGEPPARQGYPPSVFTLLPRLVERAGADSRGSITALYTVLAQGGELDDPLSEEIRAALDGHITLSSELAARQHWPAIDVLRSLSRVMHKLCDAEHLAAAAALRRMMAAHDHKRDLIAMGAYQPGSDPDADAAIARAREIDQFLRQTSGERADAADWRRRLLMLARR
jgi:type III secretion protein N (ATPase)